MSSSTSGGGSPRRSRPRPLQVAIYARVSTDDKDQNPETQLMAVREYCKRQGWKVYDEYVDRAPAGDMAHRSRWTHLLEQASRKFFDIVLVYRLDRAFRSVLDGVNTLENLDGWGVGFRSYSEPYIDTTNVFGKAMFQISAAWAELERAILSERVIDGMNRAKAQGIHVGRPRVIDLVDVELVIDLRSKGRSWRKIARNHPRVRLPSGLTTKLSVGTIRRAVNEHEERSDSQCHVI